MPNGAENAEHFGRPSDQSRAAHFGRSGDIAKARIEVTHRDT
jgi:hypothetical protein